jgi:hypothetical protein
VTTNTTPTALSPIDRLARLAVQRTARTDRLHEAVCALLSQLEPHVAVGDSVTVEGLTLSRVSQRSNVGWSTEWDFFREADEDHLSGWSCDPERPVGGEGYLHGDFSAPWRGPSRRDLLDLARRAPALVEALIAKHERTVSALVTAEAQIATAAALVSA